MSIMIYFTIVLIFEFLRISLNRITSKTSAS